MEPKQRVKRSLINASILLALGLGYYLFIRLTGWGIPCMFNLITGLHCPGCGLSRMCICLLQLDIVGAFHANALLFCAMPFVLVFGLRHWLRWVKTGSDKIDRLELVLEIIALVLVIAFWIARNLPWFSFLAPH